ncbi:E3 ubiquitin-protein ligase rnf146-like [Daktulosphaira vitifoliae]|uniref:E3 ubiquitin-protein ligase rnf146-like n=1 Tax=Daktulosphaira vitifoliae TaxID=58002 RepID=UPI0021A9E0CA|nr:E3 ubiquitin-protein ligase rnf146-like [Daktulosphaira vitifoliae]
MAASPKRTEDSISNNNETKEKDKVKSNSSASSDTSILNSDENIDKDNNSITSEEFENKTQKKSQIKKSKNSEKKNSKDLKIDSIDCPICLGTAVIPTRITCGHIFCFLCVKGVTRRSSKCPLCRQPIPSDFDKNPTVLEKHDIETLEDGYQWFYEGKNGWWLYEKRTSEEIEENFKLNNMKFDLLICGTMYTIDLDRNIQFNKENPVRRRKIKRENAENIAVKGVAGVH